MTGEKEDNGGHARGFPAASRLLSYVLGKKQLLGRAGNGGSPLRETSWYAGWVGMFLSHFASYFKSLTGSRQHHICPGFRLDVTGFGAGATLTHLSHSLNLSGAQSMDCWVYPSDFGSALPCQA